MRGSRKLVNGAAIVLLVVLVLLSTISIFITASNYRKGIDAARAVVLDLSQLELRMGDEPEIHITFRLSNGSPLDIRLENVHFSAYLNGTFMGSNYEVFAAQSLEGSEETDLNFVIPLSAFYLQHVEQAQQKEKFEWFLRGEADLRLPYGTRKFLLRIREPWSGTGGQ